MIRGLRVTACIVIAAGSVVGVANAQEPAPGADARTYLQVESVLEPETVGSDELDHIVDLRKAYGLKADREFVADLYLNPAKHDAERSALYLLGNVLFTPEEREHAFRRAAAEWVGDKVDQLAFDALPDYAGTVVNSDASITLRCSACDLLETSRWISDSLNVSEPYELTVERVALSDKELHALASSTTAMLDAQGIINSGAIDLMTNTVTIHLPDSAAHLADSLGDHITVEFGFEEVEPDINKNQAHGYNLVEGGQYITGASTALTSGFAVQSGYGPFILTAGHYSYPSVCASPGSTWSQGGSTLGIMTTACQYGGNRDGALITTSGYRNNWGRIHWTGTDDAHPVTFGVTTHNLLNQTVCQTGVATTGMNGNSAIAARCGLVSSMSSRSPCGGASPAWLFTLGAVSYVRAPGDSGAGVVWPTGYGFGAAGTHSCVGFGGTGAIFSRFSVMANAWGLTVSPW